MSKHCVSGLDLYVEPLLPEFGYACDVGANDGLFFSNSFQFEEKGWIVLCVEANPALAEVGAANRRLWRAVGCGAEDRVARFYAHGGGTSPSWSGFTAISGNSSEVQMLRLDRVLEEAGFPRLDYLTIDVEGYESEVLKGFTIERWKPTIIVAECWSGKHLDTPEGYEMIHRIGEDNIYRRLQVAPAT